MLYCKWSDYRINFQNLKQSEYENKISDDEENMVWTPKLVFSNNPQGHLVTFNPSANNNLIRLIRPNSSSYEAPMTQADEAKVYNSSETKLLMRNFYYLKFKCHFNFKYFPFDQQTCLVKVRL